MKLFYLTLLYTVITYTVTAQYTWTNMNPFGGSGVSTPSHFAINGKGYIVGGVLNFSPYARTNAVWEYDPVTDTWAQKSNFPFALDAGSSFVINNIGYVVGGANANATGWLSTTYAYDPTSDTWTPKANFPDNGLGRAAQFVINGIAYITCGTRSGAGSPSALTYAYDPVADSWSYKANFPGALVNDAVGFSIDSFGYVGCGGPGTQQQYNQFYKYDPGLDSWTQIDSLPGYPRQGPSAFVLNGKAYVGGGTSNSSGVAFDLGDIYEYDPAISKWTPVSGLPGWPGFAIGTFTIGNSGYFVGGYNHYYGVALQTVRKFTACDNISLTVPAIVNSPDAIKLFPNPTSDEINVKMEGDINSKLQYDVVSTDGKLIKSANVAKKEFSFSTRNLADGIYFITVKDAKASYSVQKFEVIH